jgi:hypothetical protein
VAASKTLEIQGAGCIRTGRLELDELWQFVGKKPPRFKDKRCGADACRRALMRTAENWGNSPVGNQA